MSSKIFIVGLPRTGTTSVCIACLNFGFKTAHTAYTKQAFQNAQVIADTPVFNDYQLLASAFPKSRFIYLERDLDLWLPSISQLLSRMEINLLRHDGGFNDTIKRCFLNTFNNLTPSLASDFDYLQSCYMKHKQDAEAFFAKQGADNLTLNVASSNALEQLSCFLNTTITDPIQMPFTNKGGKVTAWNNIRHSLKVESTRNGKVDKDALLLNQLAKS
ncbi:hypothetical protein PSECIP111951_02615 [Pseudoalteromonas holothuriae]|uniref:Sulfotransferase family protein n=1 Tax=Pseudoalteromonas holothuriae TaxID=2963714 RepID=A0ABN8UQW8_9GAMM|nr:sulfotransferase [Pseudoalteromonas sp. CIP111951]CAH9062058.1 hypothetical protein PSECIP111951_02615 [Pseudoalteromonas sp. CIP111951]